MLWTILKACAGLIVGVIVFFVLLIVLVISLFYLAISSVIVTTLFMLLRSKSEIVRKLTAQALGINRDFSYEKDLATALQHETSSRVRIAIIKSLVILSRKLLEAAKDARKRPREPPGAFTFPHPGPEHYLKAIREYIVPGLSRSLHSTDRHERDTAFSALKQIGTPEALAAIEQALNSAPSDVVQFTAYHPRDVHASAKHSLYVYAHVQHELTEVEDDVRKVTK
jgi:HEAT repeat protein